MNRTIRLAALGTATVLGVAGLVGCGGRQDNASTDTGGEISCEVGQETRIGIATGNNTGVYFAIGNAYAEQISSTSPGARVKATAAETGASVQNIQQLVAGTYAVAFSLADTAADAVSGAGSFNGRQQPVRALSRIHTNYTQVIVRNAVGARSVADLRGKRVSTGSPKSGTEVIANRLLQAAGLDPTKDIQAQRLDLTKTVDGMKDGSIDALFWSGGLPTPGITDLLTTRRNQVSFLDVIPLLTELKKINPVYEEGVIPAASYGIRTDVRTIAVPNLLLVREDLDPSLVCVLTRVLFARKSQLTQANKAVEEISLTTARRTEPVVLHRGAVRALDDLNAPR